ncbi:MAG: LysR substrate-binding domain-containing protein [Janthinobacterium lividum]
MMRRLPSLSALRAFEAAGRCGNFTAAAEELNLTPSAISHQIRALEKYFGRSLFLRRGIHVELNSDGARLGRDLSSAFGVIEEACSTFARISPAEHLSIYCAPSFASKWLGPRLPDFIRFHPGLSLRVSSGTEAIDLARHEELDVMISYGSPPARPKVIVEPLGNEETIALCTPEVAARWDLQGPAAGAMLIDSTVNPVRWADWFAVNGLSVPELNDCSSFDRGALAISAATQGLGIALESRRFALDELASGELVELGGGRYRGLEQEIHFLSYREAQASSPSILAFRTWLGDTLGQS